MRDDVAAYHANRMHVGESIGVVAALPGSFAHEGADRIVRQHQAPELLTYQLGRFAAQHNPRAAQVGLQLVEGLARYLVSLKCFSISPSSNVVIPCALFFQK